MDRDHFYMELAKLYAKRSTCDRAQVGAIITVGGRLISAGYNGSPHGMPHCDDIGHSMVDGHCVRTIHAEINALEFLSKISHYRYPDTIMYVTHLPCDNCIRYICGSIHRPKILYYGKVYGNDVKARVDKLIGAGIDVRQLQPL